MRFQPDRWLELMDWLLTAATWLYVCLVRESEWQESCLWMMQRVNNYPRGICMSQDSKSSKIVQRSTILRLNRKNSKSWVRIRNFWIKFSNLLLLVYMGMIKSSRLLDVCSLEAHKNDYQTTLFWEVISTFSWLVILQQPSHNFSSMWNKPQQLQSILLERDLQLLVSQPQSQKIAILESSKSKEELWYLLMVVLFALMSSIRWSLLIV